MASAFSPKRKGEKPKRVVRLFDAQGGLCHWCGLPMVINGGVIEPTLDHLTPRAGWRHKIRPAVAAHRVCNNMRHHDAAPPKKAINRVKRELEKLRLNRS